MNVLYCTSEAGPVAASGDLGDVASSLQKALRNEEQDVRVVMPLYSQIKEKYEQELKFVCSFNVQLGWRSQYCGIFTFIYQDVTYYFIDNEYYFKRKGLYGHFDDGERFAFFSKAILEMLYHIGFSPEVIHTNDWQTEIGRASCRERVCQYE